MTKTSVEWLYDQLTSTWYDKKSSKEIIEQAKTMEKEQIENAYKRGWDVGNFGSDCWEEVYYNETFNK